MPRMYTVEFESVATTAGTDLFELDAAAEHPIEVCGLFISQSTDVKDAEEEMIRYRIVRGNTTSGSGGSTATPRPVDDGDAAAGFTCEINNTTAASAGTAVNLHSADFNLRIGESLWLPEGCGWWTRGTTLLVCRLLAAPADSVSFTGTLYVREY